LVTVDDIDVKAKYGIKDDIPVRELSETLPAKARKSFFTSI
jgi:hypothetical protein